MKRFTVSRVCFKGFAVHGMPKTDGRSRSRSTASVPLCEDAAIIGAGRLKALRLARAILVLLPHALLRTPGASPVVDAGSDAVLVV